MEPQPEPEPEPCPVDVLDPMLGGGIPPSCEHSPVMTKFFLWATAMRFYFIGADEEMQSFRLVKIDRTEPQRISFMLDPIVYDAESFQLLLDTLREGNGAGFSLRATCRGLLGAVRFSKGYYLVLVQRAEKVGEVAGHDVHRVEEITLVALDPRHESGFWQEDTNEAHYRRLFSGVDVTNFFFSYEYDLTHSLQFSMQAQRVRRNHADVTPQERFLWNYFLLSELQPVDIATPAETVASMLSASLAVGVVCGFFQQRRISVFGKLYRIVLISRRSRHFAGTRYRKRGINNRGQAANDVETEQIVYEEGTVDSEGGGAAAAAPRSASQRFTSFVQVRGSIPLFWTQKTDATDPKPAVEVQTFDVDFMGTQLHLADLVERYGQPVVILSLIRKVESGRPRETKLGHRYEEAISKLAVHGSKLECAAAPPFAPVRAECSLPFPFAIASPCARISRHLCVWQGFAGPQEAQSE